MLNWQSVRFFDLGERSVGSLSRSRPGAQLSGLAPPKSPFPARESQAWLLAFSALVQPLRLQSRSTEAMAFAGFTHSCQLELSKAEDARSLSKSLSGVSARGTPASTEPGRCGHGPTWESGDEGFFFLGGGGAFLP